jgi:hypothetical protein
MREAAGAKERKTADIKFFRVQRGSVGSALASCKAGPSSNLGGHPMEVPPTEAKALKIWRWASANVYKCMNDV